MKMKERIEEMRLNLKLKKYDIKLLKIKQEAIDFYKRGVKDKKHISDLEVRKRITRNWILTEHTQRIYYDNDYMKAIRFYGNLKMVMNMHSGEIIYISNRKGYYKLNINETKKAELNKILGLK